jgi:hypothetical protein
MGVALDPTLERGENLVAKETFSELNLGVAGQSTKTASNCEQNKQLPKADMMNPNN